jgi:hypothetical protein
VSSDTQEHDGNNVDGLHMITSTMPDCEHGPKADAGRQQEKSKVVLIWDVDETLVLFLSLLDGSFARAFQQVLFLPSQLAQYHGLRYNTQCFIAFRISEFACVRHVCLWYAHKRAGAQAGVLLEHLGKASHNVAV